MELLNVQASAPSSQHPTHPSVLRYFLHVQSLPPVQSAQSQLPNSFPPLDIDVSTLPTPERKVVVPPKKEKKDKKAAAPAPAAGGIVEAVTGAATSAVASASGAAMTAAASVAGAAEAVKEAVLGDGKAQAKKEKKEKKEKKDKPKAEPVKDEGPQPSMIDMRVGKVLDGEHHRSLKDSGLILSQTPSRRRLVVCRVDRCRRG